MGNLIHNALQNVQIKDNIHEYSEEYCNAIYETCKDFLSKESPVFSPFQKKNAFWFDSSDTKMKHLLKSRDLLADLYSAKPFDKSIQVAYCAIKIKTRKELRQMENNWWCNKPFMERKARESQTKIFNQVLKNTYGPQKSKFMPQMVKKLHGSLLAIPKEIREMETALQ